MKKSGENIIDKCIADMKQNGTPLYISENAMGTKYIINFNKKNKKGRSFIVYNEREQDRETYIYPSCLIDELNLRKILKKRVGKHDIYGGSELGTSHFADGSLMWHIHFEPRYRFGRKIIINGNWKKRRLENDQLSKRF